MNVSLTPQLEQMIRDKVDSGLYSSASEVVREALRLLSENEQRLKIKAMRDAAIAEGIVAADRGETIELTREVWEEIMAEGDALAEIGSPIDPLISGEF